MISLIGMNQLKENAVNTGEEEPLMKINERGRAL